MPKSQPILNTIKYIFFADKADYLKIIVHGYKNPTIHSNTNLQQEIKESIRTLIAVFIIGGILLYGINNLLFFPVSVNVSTLISMPRFFISSLLSNVVFGLIFSLTSLTLFYMCYEISLNSLIKAVVFPCFFYAIKLYALIALPCILVADLIYINFLLHGVPNIYPHSIIAWINLSLFAVFSIFSIWWFYLNPIFKFIKSNHLKSRVYFNHLNRFYKHIINFLIIIFQRTTIIGILSLIVMLSIAPKIVSSISLGWKLLNKKELSSEVKRSPFYQRKLEACLKNKSGT